MLHMYLVISCLNDKRDRKCQSGLGELCQVCRLKVVMFVSMSNLVVDMPNVKESRQTMSCYFREGMKV